MRCVPMNPFMTRRCTSWAIRCGPDWLVGWGTTLTPGVVGRCRFRHRKREHPRHAWMSHPNLTSLVEIAAPAWLALEAAMDPQVLVRCLAHHLLDGLVDPRGIGFDVLAGEILQWRADLQEVLPAFAAVEVGDDRTTGHPRQLVGGGDGGGGVAEERHEYGVLAAHVLVGCVPEEAALFQVAHRRADVLVGVHRLGIAQAAELHRPLVHRVLVLAVHAGQVDVVAQQAAAHFQGHEVARDQQHAAAFGLHLLEVFQPFDVHLRADAVDAAPPGTRAFENAHTQGVEAVAHQTLAPGLVLLGEAQLEVDLGGMTAAAGQAPGDRADPAAQHALQRPRQPGDPEGSEHDGKHRPVAWITQRRTDGGGGIGHAAILPTRPRVFPGGLPYPCRMRKDPVEWILRGLYSAVLYLLLPITVYHLVWRGFRVREYFRRWDERYASYPQPSGQPRVWLHAVSVGEVNAAAPLVNALRAQRPDIRWVITTITPTGSERV